MNVKIIDANSLEGLGGAEVSVEIIVDGSSYMSETLTTQLDGSAELKALNAPSGSYEIKVNNFNYLNYKLDSSGSLLTFSN